MVMWRVAAAALSGVLASACTPVLDWRQVSAQGSGVTALFPCKPDRHRRAVSLGGRTLQMEMLACSAGGATYAIAFAELPEPAAVAPVLVDLRTAAVANIGGSQLAEAAAQVPGMTPNPQALRIALRGARPDGVGVEQRCVFFSHGLRVYQASVLGSEVPGDAAQTFLDSLRVRP